MSFFTGSPQLSLMSVAVVVRMARGWLGVSGVSDGRIDRRRAATPETAGAVGGAYGGHAVAGPPLFASPGERPHPHHVLARGRARHAGPAVGPAALDRRVAGQDDFRVLGSLGPADEAMVGAFSGPIDVG